MQPFPAFLLSLNIILFFNISKKIRFRWAGWLGVEAGRRLGNDCVNSGIHARVIGSECRIITEEPNSPYRQP